MTRFEYISIFNGIIVALALENIASSFHRLFEAGARVRWNWMAPTNAIGSATATLGLFWIFWVQRETPLPNPTFLTFLPGAVTLVMQYLVASATLPDAVPEAGIDLKEFYFSSRRQLWTLFVAMILLTTVGQVWRLVSFGFDSEIGRSEAPVLVFAPALAALGASMIFVRAAWWHTVGIIAIVSGTFFVFGTMKL